LEPINMVWWLGRHSETRRPMSRKVYGIVRQALFRHHFEAVQSTPV